MLNLAQFSHQSFLYPVDRASLVSLKLTLFYQMVTADAVPANTFVP